MDSPWWQAIQSGSSDRGLPDIPSQKVNLYVDRQESHWTSLENTQEDVRSKKLPDSQTNSLLSDLAISNLSTAEVACSIGSISQENMLLAKFAWQYFQRNWNAETGLINAVENYPWMTWWDGGSAILGIHSAKELGIISQAEFDQKISKLLNTFATLPLPPTGLPNKAYSTATAEMRQLDNTPDPMGKSGWSALDMGRFLVALHILHTHHPQYQDQIEAIVAGWNLSKLAQDGWLYGGIPKDTEIALYQEGRLGYEQYAAQALQLWGISANEALTNPPTVDIEVEGIPLKADRRNYANSNASNHLTNDPYLLLGLEMGLDKTSEEQLNKLLQAQQARYQRTGILTAVNEDSLDRPPYFLYYSVYSDGKPWQATNSRGKAYPDLQFLSTKAVFAWNALYPDDTYAQSLLQQVTNLSFSDRGFAAGVYENPDLGINKVFNVNTNAVILESLLYQSRNCPLVSGR